MADILSFEEWKKQRDLLAWEQQHQPSVERKAEVEEEEHGEFVKGLARGVDQTQAMLYGTAMLFGDAIDSNDIRKWGLDGYQEQMRQANEYKAAVGRVEDIGSWGEAADWFFGSLGEIAPSAAETIVASLVGGGIGGALGKGLLKKSIKEAVEKLVTNGAKREVAEQMVKRQLVKRAATASMVGFTWAQETGGMFAEDVESHGFKEANPTSAAMFGAAAAAAELVGAESRVIKKILGPVAGEMAEKAVKAGNRSVMKKLGLEALKSGLLEAGTEGAQEIAGMLNARYTNGEMADAVKPEEWSQLINAMAKGAVGGVGMSPFSTQYAKAADRVESVTEEENLAAVEERKNITQDELDRAILGGDADEVVFQKEKLKAAQEEVNTTREKVDSEQRLVSRIANGLMAPLQPVDVDAVKDTKTETLRKLTEQRDKAQAILEGNYQKTIFNTSLDEEAYSTIQKENKMLQHKVGEIDRILELNSKYGELIPEADGDKLFSFAPTLAQREAVEQGRAAAKRAAESFQKTTDITQKAAFEREEAVRKAVQEEELALAKQEKRNAVEIAKIKRRHKMENIRAKEEERKLEAYIEAQEAAEEAAVIADVTIEEAPERTRGFIPSPREIAITPEQAAMQEVPAEQRRLESGLREAEEARLSREEQEAGMRRTGREAEVGEAGESLEQTRQRIAEEAEAKAVAAAEADRMIAEAPERTRRPIQPVEMEKAREASFPAEEVALERAIAEREEQVAEAQETSPVRDRRTPIVEETPAETSSILSKEGKPIVKREAKREDVREKLKRRKTKDILTKSGKPFKTENSAKVALSKIGKDAAQTYYVKKVDGGYALSKRRKPLKKKAPTKVRKGLTPKAADVSSRLKKAKEQGIKERKKKEGLIRYKRAQAKKKKQRLISEMKPGKPATPEQVKAFVEEFSSNLKSVSDGRIKFVIKPSVKGANVGFKLDPRAQAVYDGDSTVYVFSDAIPNNPKELMEVLTHELRHFSIREMLGDDIINTLSGFVDANYKECADFCNRFGYEINDDNMMVAAEEIIVDKYLNGVKDTFVDRVIAAIKRFVRRIVPSLKVSDRDVKQLLVQLDKNAKERRERLASPVTPQPRYKRSDAFEMATRLVGQEKIDLNSARGVWERMKKEGLSEVYRQTLDHTLPLKDLDSPNAKTLHSKRRLLASADTMSNFSLIEGKLKWNPETKWVEIDSEPGGGVISKLKELGEDSEVFMMWMQAQSIKELKKRGYTKNFYGKKAKDANVIAVIDAEAREAIKRVGQDKWDAALKAMQETTKSKLDIAQTTGMIDAEERKTWERMMYVPLYRTVEENLVDDVRNLDPDAMRKVVKDGVKQITSGVVGDLTDPLESFIGNYKFMMNESLKNQMWKEAIATMSVLGLAKPVKQFVPNSQTLGVKAKGKTKYFQIEDAALFEALQELPPALPSFLVKILGGPKRILTKYATYSPAFQARNFIRDTFHTWVLMGDKVNFFEAWKDAADGFMSVINNSPEYREVMSQGGAFASYDESGKITSKTLSRVQSPETKMKLRRRWKAIMEAAENANRVAMYKRLRNQGAGKIEAAYEAKDVLDFSATGKSQILRSAILAIPFLNARIQGLSKIGREFNSRDRAALLARASLLSLAAMTFGFMNEDNDEWKELPDYEKFSSMHGWIGDVHIRIPLPFEVGLFYTFPMAAMEVMSGNEMNNFMGKVASYTMTETFSINPIPQAVKPVLEDWANKDTFKDRPIVGAWEKNIDPKQQYSPWTSETVKLLAQSMPDYAPDMFKSPKRLEHLLEGYFSTLSKMVFGFTDSGLSLFDISPRKPFKNYTQAMLEYSTLDRLVTMDKPKLTRKQQIVYEQMAEFNKSFNTWVELKSRRQLGKARGYLQSHRDEIQMAAYYKKWQQKLKAINTRARLIYERKKLDSYKKWEMQNKLDRERAMVFAKIYDAMVKKGVFK